MTVKEFQASLLKLGGVVEKALDLQLSIEGDNVAETAKGYLGTYQPGWAPLAPSTIARKETGDSPLLETGELRDSIKSIKERFPPDEVIVSYAIGSPEDKAYWMELGTAKVPPRPFLTLALAEETLNIERDCDRTVAEAISLVLGR